MSELNIISIPVLFDIGGDAIIFGEEVSDNFVSSHLDFVLDMTTEANDISLNAADISGAILIGDQDTGDNIFYSSGSSGNVTVDNLCNRIAKAITRGKLVHLPKQGDHSNSGIPMGGRQLANNLGELGSNYATKYMTSIAPIGDEQMLGQAMARVASVHLVGSPLAAGIFEDQNQIQADLETASAHTFNSGNTAFYNALAVQLSKVLGGSKSSAPMNNGEGGGNYSYLDVSTTGNTNNTGTIVATASGTGHNRGPERQIDGIIGYATAWIGSESQLYGTNNSYTGSVSTTYNTNQTVDGEWVQVDLGTALTAADKIGAYGLWANEGSDIGRSIRQGKLLGSNNGTDWNLVHEFTNEVNDYFTSDGPANNYALAYLKEIRVDFPTENNYRYFRIVIVSQNVTSGTDKPSFGGIALYKRVMEGYPLDASGTSVPALKSIYEQLMNVPGRSQIMETRDVGGVIDNSNVTLAGGFPFISGDKLVMYLRPKVVFAAQTKAEQSTSLITASGPISTTIDVPIYDIGRKSSAGGAISGQIYTNSSSHNNDDTWGFHKCFEGDHTDDEEWTTAGDADHVYANTSPFDYTGNQNTTNIDGSSELLGEWGQIDIGQDTVINKFQIWPRPSRRTTRSPSDFSLLGSLDGTNWTTIKAVSGLVANDWATTNGNTPAGTITWELGSVHGPYRYYRISVQSVVGSGDGRLSLTGLLLYGAKSPSEVTTGNSGSVSDISGIQTNIVATSQNIEDAFPGNDTSGPEPEANKWGWMGSTNSDSLSLETTDVTDLRTCDLHIWKITITL